MLRRPEKKTSGGWSSSTSLRPWVKNLWPMAHLLRTWRYVRDMAPLKLSAAKRTPYGFKLLTPGYGNMKIGTYEDEELSCLHRTIVADGIEVLVDVGANVGLYTCYALSKGLRTISFEPSQRNLRYLYRNIFENGWEDLCEVWPVAAASKPGLKVLYDGAGGPAASLISGWAGINPKFSSVVPAIPLDVVVGTRFRGAKLFVKIDVEGAELEVLRGANELLKRSPPPVWQIENCLSEWHPGRFNQNFRSVFELLASHGYEAKTADEELREVRLSDVDRWIEKCAIPFSQREFLFTRSL
jgi:FkbM family methyltransferase